MAFHFPISKRRQRLVSRRGLSTAHLHQRRLTIEQLEKRELLSANEIIPNGEAIGTAVAIDPPVTVLSLSTIDEVAGTIPADTTSLDVLFSGDVLLADLPASYELRGAAADGLLGTADDSLFAVTSTVNQDTASLSFAALPEDIYRLTIFDTITNIASDPLDGDADGTAGGEYAIDFVAGALTTTLTSPNGFDFDIEFGGFGAGQIV